MKAIKMICKVIDTFTDWTGRVFACLPLITLGVIVYEVTMRRFFNSPKIWTMDMITISFGCYVILISAYGLMRKGFVAVDVVYNHLPVLGRHIMDLVTLGIFFCPFAYSLLPTAYRFFLKAYNSGELAYSVWQPPTWPVKLALFVGLALLAVQGVSEILGHVDWIISYFRNGRKDPDALEAATTESVETKEGEQ